MLAVGDAADADDVARIVAEVSEELGSIDVFVANASGPQPVIELADMTWRDVEAHHAEAPRMSGAIALTACR